MVSKATGSFHFFRVRVLQNTALIRYDNRGIQPGRKSVFRVPSFEWTSRFVRYAWKVLHTPKSFNSNPHKRASNPGPDASDVQI